MDNKPNDTAIDNAASHLIKKVEKRHKKHSDCDCQKMSTREANDPSERRHKISHSERQRNGSRSTSKISQPCVCAMMEMMKIEEGTKSPLMRSPGSNRKVTRREGVAERNELERMLAREAVKEISKNSDNDRIL